MDIILGLDVSTSCIGVALASVNENKVEILQLTHFKLVTQSRIKGMESLFIKSKYFESVLKTYADLSGCVGNNLKVTKIIIEEPLISSNNSRTVSTLLRFNGMISLSAYQILGIIPEFITSYEAREYAFPELMAIRKYNKSGEAYPVEKIRSSLKRGEIVLFGEYPWDCDKKLILWEKVSRMYPEIEWQYDKSGKLKKENFDASDSMVCVLGYVNKTRFPNGDRPKVVGFDEKEHDGRMFFAYRTRMGDMEYNKLVEIP